MTEMTEKDQAAKIRKGMGPRRSPACVQVLQDIVIPAGTILRDIGGGEFAAEAGECGRFVVDGSAGVIFPASRYKRVIA